jgi:hypothetical protein
MINFTNILRSAYNKTTLIFNPILHFIRYKNSQMHVKISEKGRAVINNKELASKLVETIVNNKQLLEKGNIVRVDGENIGVRFVTTIEEKPTQKNK